MFLQLRKEYEEKLKAEEKLRQERLRQEQLLQGSNEGKEGKELKELKRIVFGINSSKKGNRIQSKETKKYHTLSPSTSFIQTGIEASDSENEIDESEETEVKKLSISNVDDFYNDKSKSFTHSFIHSLTHSLSHSLTHSISSIETEKNIRQAIRNIEIEQLLKSDSLESPKLETCSSSNSIVHTKKRKGSMEISRIDSDNEEVWFSFSQSSIELYEGHGIEQSFLCLRR